MACTAAAPTTLLKRWFGKFRQQSQQSGSECCSSRSSTCSGSDLMLLENCSGRARDRHRDRWRGRSKTDPVLTSSGSSSSCSSSSLLIQDDKAAMATTTMRLCQNGHGDAESLDDDDGGGGGHVNGGLLLEEEDLKELLRITDLDLHITEKADGDTEADSAKKAPVPEDEDPHSASREFSFTFYDLDGAADSSPLADGSPIPVSKDDIASLVRTIYGAVSSSITVPRRGKRTIRVKVSVSEEDGAAEGEAEEEDLMMAKDGSSEREHERQRSSRVHFPSDLTSPRHRSRRQRRGKKSNVDRQQSQPQPGHCHEECAQCTADQDHYAAADRALRRSSWRSSSHGHRHSDNYDLREILRMNMAKNNVSCCGVKQPLKCYSEHSTPLRLRCRRGREMEHNSNMQCNAAAFDNRNHGHSGHRRRSHSQDNACPSPNPQTLNNQRHFVACSTPPPPPPPCNRCSEHPSERQVPPPPKLNNLHTQKHLHRAQEQRRAMAQVVSWLEQGTAVYKDQSQGQPRVHKHEHVHHHHHYHHHHRCPELQQQQRTPQKGKTA